MSSSPGSPGPAMTLSPLYALTFCQIICLPLQIKARLAQGAGLPHWPAQSEMPGPQYTSICTHYRGTKGGMEEEVNA